LHYDDVAAKRRPDQKRKATSVFASVAYAHRKQLNQQLVLPRRVKEILCKPSDEERWDKLDLLCDAVRAEIERVEDVYLNSEEDIERLACAVEACLSEKFGNEVGPGFEAIPEGSRLASGAEDDGVPSGSRATVAETVRGMEVGRAICVKLRPMASIREPPLDPFGVRLMRKNRDTKAFTAARKIAAEQKLKAPEMRDLLLVALWDALFLTACEHWTGLEVTNTTPTDAHELGWWFNRGQEIGKEPLFSAICVEGSGTCTLSPYKHSHSFHRLPYGAIIKAMCGCLLHQNGAGRGIGNTCYGKPLNRDGDEIKTPTGESKTDAQPPFLSRA